MAWAELFPDALGLQLKNGVVKWNTALQMHMGDPPWVELMYDSANGWLGIRSANLPTGLPVIKDLAVGEYKIDSEALLDDAGVPIDITVNALPPDSWRQATGGVGEELHFNKPAIYYLTLP